MYGDAAPEGILVDQRHAGEAVQRGDSGLLVRGIVSCGVRVGGGGGCAHGVMDG